MKNWYSNNLFIRVSQKPIFYFVTSQIFSKTLNMLSGFLVIKLVEPAEYGLFNGASIFMGYLLVAQFGLLNGLGRELPFQIAKGNIIYATRLASTSWTVSIFLSICGSLFFLIMAAINLKNHNILNGYVFLSYVVISFFYLLNIQFLPILYRTVSDFKSLSKQSFQLGFFNILSVLMVFYFGFTGLILRGVFLSLSQFVLLFRNQTLKIKLLFNINDFKLLLKTGFPIFIVGYINVIWNTLSNQYIYTNGGAYVFGIYTLCFLVQTTLGVIPLAYGSYNYPFMTKHFAEGKSVSEIIYYNTSNLRKIFFLNLILSLIAYFIIPLLVPIILPKYINGIKAAQWMCFIPVLQSFDSVNNLYNIFKKQKFLIISLLTGVLVAIFFVIFMIDYKGFYLELFPQSMLIGIFIQQFLSLYFIKKIDFK